jgi:hypothetical protein
MLPKTPNKSTKGNQKNPQKIKTPLQSQQEEGLAISHYMYQIKLMKGLSLRLSGVFPVEMV